MGLFLVKMPRWTLVALSQYGIAQVGNDCQPRAKTAQLRATTLGIYQK